MSTHTGSLEQGFLHVSGTFQLYHGGVLNGVRLAWRLAGAPGAPIVLVLGGISANRVVFSAGEERGWWDCLVGPGRALDTRQVRILGIDFLGGSAESTGPRAAAGQAEQGSFPSVSTYDQAELIRRLLDHLRIDCLHGVMAASYGGMVALALAEKHSQRVGRLLIMGAADRTHPMSTAWRSVQRQILRFALKKGDGAEGVRLARALAMATYRSPQEFAQRFSREPRLGESGDNGFVFPVEEYLFARGADYAGRYDAAAFLCLSESIDLHAVDVSRIRVPLTAVGFVEDQLVPIGDVRALCARAGEHARCVEIHSLYGHDAFLKEPAQLAPIVRTLLETPVHDLASRH